MKHLSIEVFENAGGDITIKQENQGRWEGDDIDLIIISIDQVTAVCSELKSLKKEIELRKLPGDK